MLTASGSWETSFGEEDKEADGLIFKKFLTFSILNLN